MPRERIPRQSLSNSGVAPTPSSTDGAIPSLSLDTSSLQTSISTPSTSVAPSNPLVTLTESKASSSIPTSVAPTTTTSSPTETTSTPQTTSQPTTSSVPHTTSQTPPSSAPSHTTLPTPLSPSSAPESTTTPPSTSPPSPSGSQTTITSSFTTFINGTPVPTQTVFPSTIPQVPDPSSSERTAVIAGSAAGGTILLIILLSLAFCTRRKQFKRVHFLHALTLKRRQARTRATLLDGDDLDDVNLSRPPQRHTDYDTPWDGSTRSLMGGRACTPGTTRSDAGSTFREDVWPPPLATEGTRLMDPLANQDDVDLAHIVDDVMGPSAATVHFSDRSVISVHRGSVAESDGVLHSRTVSDASNTALLDAAGFGGPSAVAMSTAPVRSSPLTQPGTKPRSESVEQDGGGVS